MEWSIRRIAATQVDKQLKKLRGVTVPPVGWIKTIRKILGMNIRQLGERVGVSSERIIRIESDEINEKLTIGTLKKVATAMNCHFVYALVPNEEICTIIEKEARSKVIKQLARISHTMALEDQKINDKELKEQIDILTEEYLRGNIKKVWDK